MAPVSGKSVERKVLVAIAELLSARRYAVCEAMVHERISELDGGHNEPLQPRAEGSSTERSRRCRAKQKAAATGVAATHQQRVAGVAGSVAIASLSSSDLNASKGAEDQGFETKASFQLSTKSALEGGNGNADATRDATPVETAQRVARERRLRSTDERKGDKRATPIAADWAPNDSHRALAEKHGLDLDLELTSFRGHFEGRSVLSANGRFTKWLCNAAKWRSERGSIAAPRSLNGRTAQPSSLEAFERQQAEERSVS